MAEPIVLCECGEEMRIWHHRHRLVLMCTSDTCGRTEPLPAAMEVWIAGGRELPGLETDG